MAPLGFPVASSRFSQDTDLAHPPPAPQAESWPRSTETGGGNEAHPGFGFPPTPQREEPRRRTKPYTQVCFPV